ncbi:MAG TPA: S8 family serine peptidase [bacterium]|jgi:subtilisin family serine protease
MIVVASLAQPITTEEWDGQNVELVKGRAILTVKADGSFAALSDLCKQYSITVHGQHPSLRMYYLSFPESLAVVPICEAFEANPNTNHCNPDLILYPQTADSCWQWQWSFKNTGQTGSGQDSGRAGADMMIEEAFAITRGSRTAKIAILDSGVPYDTANHRLSHPDLDDSTRILLGRLCLDSLGVDSNDWNFDDVFGHGTHVAGIALAEENNYGVVGVCPQCTGVIEKIVHWNSSLPSFQNCIDGIYHADSAFHAPIISMSYGRNSTDIPNCTMAIEEAISHGVLFTFPSGNGTDQNSDCLYPAKLSRSHPQVMAIAGTNPNDRRWRSLDTVMYSPFDIDTTRLMSIRGQSVTVAAPAGGLGDAIGPDDCMDIVSDRPIHPIYDMDRWMCTENPAEAVWYKNGTSMATPAVAGIAGLLKSYDSTLTAVEVKEIIQQSADRVYGDTLQGVRNDTVGYGRVNAFKALLRAPGVKTLTSSLTVRKHIYDAYSPYYVEGGLIVPAGKTLTLQPGARLTFGPNAYIEVQGKLSVLGTTTDTVRFEAANPAQPWQGIHVNGGEAHVAYAVIKGATVPFFSENAAGLATPLELRDSRIIGGITGLRIWGSSTRNHVVERVIVQDVPNLASHAGLYFLNTNVTATDLTVTNCGYRTGYIVNTTGTCTRGFFNGTAANYGLAFSGATTGMLFRCSTIDHIGPSGYPSASVWCMLSAAPVFGDLPLPTAVNNTIVDKTAFLIRFTGIGGRPVIDGRLNRLEQLETANGTKFIAWENYVSGTQYGAKVTYWGGVVPQTSNFEPTDPRFWNFNSYRLTDPGLCPQGSPLDEEVALDSALYLEQTEAWTEAQSAYLSIAADESAEFSARARAAARAVMMDRKTQSMTEAETANLTDAILAGATSLRDSVMLERTRLCFLTDRAEYAQAIQGHAALLERNLEPEDSLLTVMDIAHVQLLAGEGSGNGLDAVQGSLPPRLTVTSREQGLSMVNRAMESLLGLHTGQRVSDIPTDYTLYQNYPNPFNPVTEIRFDLPEAARVELKVFNTLGQLVTTLVSETRPAGSYTAMWDGKDVAAGMYIYQLKAGNFTDAKKMVLIK